MVSCTETPKEYVGAIKDRAKTPRMFTDSVSTVVSDSGITRYRISAPVWEVFDAVAEPYWEFPQGIHFERFDQNLKVDANIKSNYAHFNINRKTWDLRGKVFATNIEGTTFSTEQMFWDQNAAKIYSDSLITITQPDGSIFIGHNGFESNQQLTKYIVKNIGQSKIAVE